jgi:3'(2'), 5'-bisphosphate nucleotidase
MLSRGIKKHYPQIKIVGEEEVEYEGEISTNYEAMGTIKLPEEAKFNKKYNLNDICIWIDPIDNTRGFIEG